MPDFYYKAKNETKCAPAPRSKTVKSATKKVVKKTATGAKVEPESSNSKDESFSRNSRKYATMPAKRTSDLIQVETENYSDTEQAAVDESDEETPSR